MRLSVRSVTCSLCRTIPHSLTYTIHESAVSRHRLPHNLLLCVSRRPDMSLSTERKRIKTRTSSGLGWNTLPCSACAMAMVLRAITSATFSQRSSARTLMPPVSTRAQMTCPSRNALFLSIHQPLNYDPYLIKLSILTPTSRHHQQDNTDGCICQVQPELVLSALHRRESLWFHLRYCYGSRRPHLLLQPRRFPMRSRAGGRRQIEGNWTFRRPETRARR